MLGKTFVNLENATKSKTRKKIVKKKHNNAKIWYCIINKHIDVLKTIPKQNKISNTFFFNLSTPINFEKTINNPSLRRYILTQQGVKVNFILT